MLRTHHAFFSFNHYPFSFIFSVSSVSLWLTLFSLIGLSKNGRIGSNPPRMVDPTVPPLRADSPYGTSNLLGSGEGCPGAADGAPRSAAGERAADCLRSRRRRFSH